MAAPPVIARTAQYFHTRVGRTELDKLLRVAGEGAPAGTVSVKCTVGSAQLQEDTLDDLIAVRAALPQVSARTPWDNLTLERDEGAARFVGIEFADGVVTVTVKSTDPIWTHGQVHRLGEILEEADGSTWREDFLTTGFFTLPPTVAAVVLFIFLDLSVAKSDRDGSFYGMEIGLALIAVGLSGATARRWFKLRSMRPVLKVTSEVEPGSTWSRLTSTDRIAVASAVIAGLTLVATAAALI